MEIQYQSLCHAPITPILPMGQQTTIYPTEEQHARWKEQADEMGMSLSEYIASMTEAGAKKFTVNVEPDEERVELRQQRNELKDELENARERIQELERERFTTEQETIVSFVEENPGCTFTDIVNKLANSVRYRLTPHLERMEGHQIRTDGEEYYPVEQ